MKWVSLSRNKSRARRTYSTRPHPRALVYRGPASQPGCPEAVADLLSSSAWNFDVHFVGPDEKLQIDEQTLHSAALYAQPGGGDLDGAFTHLRRHVPAIQHFVRAGGRYLGFCLGGYLAGRSPGFELLPGDADQYVTLPNAEVHDTKSAVLEIDWRGHIEEMYFQDGPYFSLDHRYRDYYDNEADILARYRNGSIAALKTDNGKGRVGVIGPHPEADESWYKDDGLIPPHHFAPNLGHHLINSVMTR
ncbi:MULTISPECIES: BPL-N domain-containing protein [unclassified Rhodococcus (in: high G+C Gram-positive bacteria)]|uniref:BPL-N domain-containing protein n=1 Tax=unclassified Rhodococcus (in: high G+C Gram-positive bacteria) TaxID=192944 RepID=UPI0009F99D9C|nr:MULTISPECIES: BPL-N domain-containing protein [unclassified Rhodococcus (in: high G+C Gram-positive bacteria)]